MLSNRIPGVFCKLPSALCVHAVAKSEMQILPTERLKSARDGGPPVRAQTVQKVNNATLRPRRRMPKPDDLFLFFQRVRGDGFLSQATMYGNIAIPRCGCQQYSSGIAATAMAPKSLRARPAAAPQNAREGVFFFRRVPYVPPGADVRDLASRFHRRKYVTRAWVTRDRRLRRFESPPRRHLIH